MDKITPPIYKDYPEIPYISPKRDLEAWSESPESFPYGIVPRKNMKRLEEEVLPGHIVMLWRIHFDNFTTESIIPEYFEYRYGVDSQEAIQTLIDKGYIKRCSAQESLDCLTIPRLKKLLLQANLPVQGKKNQLLERVNQNLAEAKLASLFTLRRYRITPKGEILLDKYSQIIMDHGPKM